MKSLRLLTTLPLSQDCLVLPEDASQGEVVALSVPSDRQVEQLVSDHLYLIQHIVNDLTVRYPGHVDRQDLWSAGAVGLVDAARRYATDSAVPFAHYARRRIRGAILDSTRQRDWATRGVRRDERELNAAASAFEQLHQRAATEAELAEQLGVDEQEVTRRRAAVERGTLLHLDQPSTSGDGEERSLGEMLPDGAVEDSPEGRLERRELLGALRTAVRLLTDVQRDVVERYYLGGELLRDIAEGMGVTEGRVSQLRAEAVRALQAYLASADYGVAQVDAGAAGERQRAAFVARVTENSTWRQRLDAADDPSWAPLTAVSG